MAVTKKRVKAGTSNKAAAAKRALFVEAYITNGKNATRAAIEAGYSEATAGQAGYRLLKDVDIAAEIRDRTESELDRARRASGISIERTLTEAARLAYFDLAQLFDQHGNLKEIVEWPEGARASIAGIEVVEEFQGKGKDREHVGWVKKVKFADKNAALEKLMKHLGLYREDNLQQPPTLPPSFVIVGVAPK